MTLWTATILRVSGSCRSRSVPGANPGTPCRAISMLGIAHPRSQKVQWNASKTNESWMRRQSKTRNDHLPFGVCWESPLSIRQRKGTSNSWVAQYACTRSVLNSFICDSIVPRTALEQTPRLQARSVQGKTSAPTRAVNQ